MRDIIQVLKRGVDNIYPSPKELGDLLAKKKITVYQGFDPTMPSLTLGNFVGLMKLRAFQQLGHKVIFLIGDFTGMIGDPTDKLATRKKLSRAEVNSNFKSWQDQIKNILKFEGDNAAEIKFNSAWNDNLTFEKLIEITSNFTVQQMIERDMFQKRISNNSPIYLHEFLYPVVQAIDCVEMNVDLEIGGSDQLFNMLAGRTLMKTLKNKDKFVLTTKLLVDKDGQKVGKTTGNAVFLDLPSDILYARIMAFPDETILPAFELLTEVDLTGLKEEIEKNPMIQKKRLAFEIVKLLRGQKEAADSQKSFEHTFQEQNPDFNKKVTAKPNLIETLASIPEVGSISQAKRLIKQGAIDVNGQNVKDINLKTKKGDKVKVGKKLFITIT